MKNLLSDAEIPFTMYPKMPGNPDFLLGEKAALFCDSAFWHGRNWKKLKHQLERGSNASYWVNHILENRTRDKRVNALLRDMGYTVIRFWDDDIYERPRSCLKTIRKTMRVVSKASRLTGARLRGSQNLRA